MTLPTTTGPSLDTPLLAPPTQGSLDPVRLARGAVAFAFVSSVADYADNYVRYRKYFSGTAALASKPGVWVAWLVFSAAAVAALMLVNRSPRAAALLLCTYAVSGLIGPLHYRYAPPATFDVLQHALIGLDFTSGLVVICAAYQLLVTRAG